jgi:hypothetical protein
MGFLEKGKIKENAFASLFNSVVNSNKEQDINEHWDVQLNFKIDVKSLKKISRSDYEKNEFYHFVELKNVNGDLGWLYGNADFFAFETNEYWILVSKEHLQDFISKNVSKTKVDSVDKCLYCLYNRDKRKDLITMVKTIDLMFISTEIIKKTTDIVTTKIGESVIPEKRLKDRIKNLI